jgi:hypothetical protein
LGCQESLEFLAARSLGPPYLTIHTFDPLLEHVKNANQHLLILALLFYFYVLSFHILTLKLIYNSSISLKVKMILLAL